MFFESVEEIPAIARKVSTAIFVVPDEAKVELAGAIVLSPEGKATITIEQVRDVMAGLATRQLTDQFIVIRPADKLGEEAENAILKSLEEPGEHVHYVLVTSRLSGLLPTIRSRAAIYILRQADDIKTIAVDEKTKALSKRLLAAKQAELVELADELTRKKDGVRAEVLRVLETAVEMAYKTYLATGKEVFLAKIEKLIAAYEAVSKNGNIKLQIVANLV